jgi:GNAT superfamily N-acetyltransferase
MSPREWRRLNRPDTTVTLRPATPQDREWALALRNAPDVLAQGRGATATAAWWRGVESSLWIIERGGERIGYLIDAPAFIVSLALDARYRGRGYGTRALRRFLREHGDGSPSLAWIRRDNAASLRAFEKAGFREDHHRDRQLLRIAAR